MGNFLEALGLSSVSTVGISVSASNVIEMICIDKSQRMITKYACKELKYNNAIREIISYEDFAEAIQDLFKEINVTPKNSNVVLNIPNVHFSFSSLPLVLPDEQISTAIASEVEEMYLFKRHEPVISWNTVNVNKETEKRYIVYGAIQENTIQNIKDIFEELGAKLIAVETSNSSMIKGIIYSKVLEEEFIGNDTTNILLIGSNSYSIFCMQGKKLVDYFEEPLAIKSFSSDEVYVAISSAAGTALENYPAKNLLVVSETNDVSAEILCHKINFEGNLKYLDRNMYADKSFMEISPTVLTKYSPMISLEAVGAAAYTYETFPIKFNFLLGEDSEISQMLTLHVFDQDYEIDRRAVLNISTILGVLILGLFLLLSFGLSVLEKKLLSEIATMKDQFVEAQTKINATNIGGDVNNIYNVSKQISDENEKDLALIYALGSEIPDDVYLTHFSCNSRAEVRILGRAQQSESIYAYVKSLKAKYPGLKISRLNLGNPGSDMESAYQFVIESEAAAKNPAENTDDSKTKDAKGNAAGTAPAANAAAPAAPQANAPGGLPAPAAP
ncbi:MAG: hypothetical protein K6C94_09860 [Candidatus Gastranaerophilales bacterium]|nr:hypothetical protein [Candidatus Gastranaerophilales bacterium]